MVTNGKQSTLRRPISCLYPLELDPKTSDMNATPVNDKSKGEAVKSQDSTSPDDKSQNDDRPTRPIRAATVKAQQRVSQWVSELTDSM